MGHMTEGVEVVEHVRLTGELKACVEVVWEVLAQIEGQSQWEVGSFWSDGIPVGWEPFAVAGDGSMLCRRRVPR